MNEPRPHDQQSALERTLRALLYHPADLKTRSNAALPGHIRRKEYRDAANCQDSIRKAEGEIEKWEDLLRLYEQERGEWENALTDFRYSQDELEAACGGELAMDVRSKVLARRQQIEGERKI